MGSAAVIEASLGAGLATAQALDLGLAVLSLALFLGYHVWYYSWHLWVAQGAMWERGDTAGSGGRYHRLDMTGQSARYLFTRVGGVCIIALAESGIRQAPFLP